MMEGGSRSVRWKDEVRMENLDQFVMETAPQVSLIENPNCCNDDFGEFLKACWIDYVYTVKKVISMLVNVDVTYKTSIFENRP